MTIQEALQTLNVYPIPPSLVEKVCIDRGLVPNTIYSSIVAGSQSFELATADVFFWLGNAPDIVEQAVGINQAIAIKKQLKDEANKIYGNYGDSKFNGTRFGFIGESFNG